MYKYGEIFEGTYKDKNEIISTDNYAEIILTNRDCAEIARAKIDISIIDIIQKCKWHLTKKGYVRSKHSYLHQLVLAKKEGMQIDHINRDKLDNRSCNLRYATASENMVNNGAAGVCWSTLNNKWVAYITKNYKTKWLGYFKTKEEATAVRRKAELEIFGEFARVK